MTGENGKNVLVYGNGGREHAICWKLAQSDRVNVIHSLPTSPGIEQVDKVKAVHGVDIKDFKVRSHLLYKRDVLVHSLLANVKGV
jgi:phosphoribosylamine-glycine ligase